MPPTARLSLSAIALCLAACASSSQPDAGVVDSGPNETLPDSGTSSGGCAEEGQSCDPVNNPCCTLTCVSNLLGPDGTPITTEVVNETCDPGSNSCIPIVELDGGVPTCPESVDDGGTTGGIGGASADCAVWQVQTAIANIAALNGLAVPSPAIQVAVGTGAGQGQLLVPETGPHAAFDGGLYPPDGGVCAPYDAGPATTWSVDPSIPVAGTLNGVWADSAGDVFAVGQNQANTGLLLAGNLDAGLQAVALDGGQLTHSLISVLGLGPTEALAGGFTSQGTPAVIHLLPDGGVVSESVPSQLSSTTHLTQIDKLAGSAAGPIYALGIDNLGESQVLERTDGGWILLEPPATSPVLVDLAVGPGGELWLVGSDGSQAGEAFTLVDGGLSQVDLYDTFGSVAPLAAVYETGAGELFIAAVPPPKNPTFLKPKMLHRLSDVWDFEPLPAETVSITAIAGDAAGNLFAVGAQEGVTVDPNPDAGGEASVPLVLQRLIP